MSANAALSGEQRDHPTLNLATFSTKADLNWNCQALRIRLKCFVSPMPKGYQLQLRLSLHQSSKYWAMLHYDALEFERR
ncbi:hypothetical protein D5E70_23780 [Vibrio parahaemolyticus]|nr:hypothetical protein D5E70_23780 [Vibrio parahaemolyticus]